MCLNTCHSKDSAPTEKSKQNNERQISCQQDTDKKRKKSKETDKLYNDLKCIPVCATSVISCGLVNCGVRFLRIGLLGGEGALIGVRELIEIKVLT